jgi:hypothetical protein
MNQKSQWDLYYLDFLNIFITRSYILCIGVDKSSTDYGTKLEAAQKRRTSEEECLLSGNPSLSPAAQLEALAQA